MDGFFAPLDEICDLAERYDVLVMVDDSHAVGFVGASGAGTPQLFGVTDRVGTVSGTRGKALGGASGGYISSHAAIVELLRQRARPYLFSNAVAPSVVAGTLCAFNLIADGAQQRGALWRNASDFRQQVQGAGFDLLPGEHAIIAVMFPDAHDAVAIADALFTRGIYVTPFSYPVVPLGKARIRVQISAGHTSEDIAECVAAWRRAKACRPKAARSWYTRDQCRLTTDWIALRSYGGRQRGTPHLCHPLSVKRNSSRSPVASGQRSTRVSPWAWLDLRRLGVWAISHGDRVATGRMPMLSRRVITSRPTDLRRWRRNGIREHARQRRRHDAADVVH